MAFEDFLMFVFISERCGSSKTFISTSMLASHFNMSQQSASRKLREFESLGLIERKPTTEGTEVSLTVQGRDFIKQVSSSLSILTRQKKKETISGVVCSGLGEGGYYTSLAGYSAQFREKLGFLPFKGTLNLKSNEFHKIDDCVPLIIDGFTTKERTFGRIKCYRVLIEGSVQGSIILPERSNHIKGILEIIAPVNLRKELCLKDGSKVKLSLQ